MAVLLAPIELAVSLLPIVAPLGIGSLGGLLVGFSQFNSFLPLAEAVTALGIVLGVQFATFGFRVIVTVKNMLPFL